MVQINQNNNYNEMILKLMDQLETIKSNYDKFAYDFSKNLKQNKAEFQIKIEP